jgi:hypothetical protein
VVCFARDFGVVVMVMVMVMVLALGGIHPLPWYGSGLLAPTTLVECNVFWFWFSLKVRLAGFDDHDNGW